MDIRELRGQMTAILNKAKAENRALTADEETAFADLKAKKEVLTRAAELEREDKEERETPELKVKGERRDFSLVKAINAVISGRAQESVEASVLARGLETAKGGTAIADGQIRFYLPAEERSAITATGAADAVAKSVTKGLDPLYYAETLNALGVTRMSNLRDNVSIPNYAGTTVAWATETGAAADGAGAVAAKLYTPHRLTAIVPISRQLLLQDAAGIEGIIRRDMFSAVAAKLEQSIFAAADVTNAPKAIFNGITAKTAATTYADVCKLESTLENGKHFVSKAKYLLSIGAKEDLRQIVKGAGLGLVYENGAVLGTEAVVSGNVAAKGIALADWSEFVVAQWGGVEVIVDPYSLAANGQIKFVVNAYFDAGFRRDNAVAAAVLKA